MKINLDIRANEIRLTPEQARETLRTLNGVSTWFKGFCAGRPDAEHLLPRSLSELRSLRSAIQQGLEDLEKATPFEDLLEDGKLWGEPR